MTTENGQPFDDQQPSEDQEPVCYSTTRRRFLAALGATVVVGVAGGYGIAVWGRRGAIGTTGTTTTSGPVVTSMPAGSAGPVTDRTLVIIEMGGGNDGLNMVVPHATDVYYDLRRDLAIDAPLDLDGEIGLHPELTFIAQRYADGAVAIVEGVGYPDPNLSHFASMATWWSGMPGSIGQTGWLGRYLDGTVGSDDPLAGVSIGPGPTPAMAGERSFVVTVQDMTGLAPSLPPWIDTNDELLSMWQGFAPAKFDGAVLLDQVRSAIDTTVIAANRLSDIFGEAPEPVDGAQQQGRRRRGDLTSFMEVAAALVVAPSAPKVIYIHGWGDFDVHDGHANRHRTMMQALNDALAEFFGTVDDAGVSDKVMVMTTSEFGRRPKYNGSGTDHGTAASHLLIGTPIKGGRYGEAPSLTNLDNRGNMTHTVDYRSLYATVLGSYLESDAESLLGASYEELPLFI